MEFTIGQVFVSINLTKVLKGEVDFNLIAPIGKHMLSVKGSVMKGASEPLEVNVIVYERGDENAEKSAKA